MNQLVLRTIFVYPRFTEHVLATATQIVIAGMLADMGLAGMLAVMLAGMGLAGRYGQLKDIFNQFNFKRSACNDK